MTELIALDTQLLVMEIHGSHTAVFAVSTDNATNILGGAFDDVTTRPSLEQVPDPLPLVVCQKKLVVLLTADKDTGVPNKMEGMTLMADGSLVLINDDDFGAFGDRTVVVRLPNVYTGE